MASPPYMQLYIGDYMRDTRGLTAEQHGAYLLLLMTMWNAGGELPHDDKKLARYASCTSSRWSKIKDDVLAFFEVGESAITHGRLLLELEKAREKSIKRADSGIKGAQAKSLKNKGALEANASRLLKHSSEPEPEKKDTQAKACVERASAPPPAPKTARASRLAPDFRPKAATLAQIRDETGASDAEIERELAKAIDWSASAKNGAKTNHDAFIRNWFRSAAEDGKLGRGPPGIAGTVLDLDRHGNFINDRQSPSQNRAYPAGRSNGSGAHDQMRACLAVAFDDGGDRGPQDPDDSFGQSPFFGSARRN